MGDRERLAARIAELFDLEVVSGLAPNEAALKATHRAAKEVHLLERCALFFPHVDREVAEALVTSAPDARLSLALATSLIDLNSDCEPPCGPPSPNLLVLDPLESLNAHAVGKARSKTKRTCDGSATSTLLEKDGGVSTTDLAAVAPILARRVTLVVSSSEGWEVESVEVNNAAVVPVQMLAPMAFCAKQVGNVRLRVSFRRVCTIIGEEDAAVIMQEMGVKIESVTLRFVAAIDRCYDSFFNAPLVRMHQQQQEAGVSRGNDGEGETLRQLEDALINLCLSVNDDLASFHASAFGGGGGLLGMARAIGAGDMLDGLSQQIEALQQDLGKAMDDLSSDSHALSKLHHTVFQFIPPDTSGGGSGGSGSSSEPSPAAALQALMSTALPPAFVAAAVCFVCTKWRLSDQHDAAAALRELAVCMSCYAADLQRLLHQLRRRRRQQQQQQQQSLEEEGVEEEVRKCRESIAQIEGALAHAFQAPAELRKSGDRPGRLQQSQRPEVGSGGGLVPNERERGVGWECEGRGEACGHIEGGAGGGGGGEGGGRRGGARVDDARVFWQLHISPAHAMLGTLTGGGIFGGGRGGGEVGGGGPTNAGEGGAIVRVELSACVSKEIVVVGGARLDAVAGACVEALAGEAVTIGSVFGYKLGGSNGTELDEGARLLTQAVRAGFGYVTTHGGRVVLLHNMRRACLFLRPNALTLPPPCNRKMEAKRRDVARVLRQFYATSRGSRRLALRVNTDFAAAVAGLRAHHKAACWLTPELEACWALMLSTGALVVFELWHDAGDGEGESLVAADFGHAIGGSFYVATRFFSPQLRKLQVGFVLALASAAYLSSRGFELYDLGGTDSSVMMAYKARICLLLSSSPEP